MLDAVAKILVGLFALAGVCLTAYLGWKQFSIKRNDEKEAKGVQLMIDNSIKAARKEITEEINAAVKQGIIECSIIGEKAIQKNYDEILQKLEEGLSARSKEGEERFNTHAKSISAVNKQIEQNSKQIGELTTLTQSVLENMESISTIVTVSAESQRNSNYDRLLIVTHKILETGEMTISELTNLKQLYQSWKALNGNDAKMDTMYEECLKINPRLDDNI